MTEQEYINVTNLAKLRAAIRVLSDTIATNPEDAEYRTRALETMCKWQEKLEAIRFIR